MSDDDFDNFLRDCDLLRSFTSCGHCGHAYGAPRDNGKGKIYRCTKKNCQKAVSITKGSFFEGNHVTRKKVFELSYYWCRKNTLQDELQFQTREGNSMLSPKTVVDHKQFCRDICAEYFMHRPIKIGGPGVIVEIDETALSRRKYHRGRIIRETQWLYGGVVRGGFQDAFLVPVARRDAATLLPILQKYVLPGSTIMSDCWAAYGGIANLPEGYQHLQVNHSLNYVNPDNGAHTQTIESNWQKFKSTHKSRYGTHRSLLCDYINEFLWRKRFGGDDAFYWFWEHVSLKYKVNAVEEDADEEPEAGQVNDENNNLEWDLEEGEIP